MSQENVEGVRRGYDAWNRGDLETFLQMFDPDVELQLPEGGLNVGVRRGRQAIKELLQGFLEVWDDLRAEPERFFESGDQIIAFVRVHGRGKGSGVEVETRPAHLATVRSSKVVRLVIYPERARALETLGLSEQDAHAESS
jgi:ketosteroid isomerase-like protein